MEATTSAVLTTREAAAYLGIHPVTLRRLAETGRVRGIQYTVPGGRWFFEQRDLDVWLEQNKRRPV